MPPRSNRPDERGLYRCGRCDEYKPSSEFWVDKSRTDGIRHECKPCSLKRFREEVYPKIKVSERHKRQHAMRIRRGRAKHPERVKAREMVQGKGLKKSACERCGATEKLEMHHPDYSKPLEVVTLCVPCHRIADKEVRVA